MKIINCTQPTISTKSSPVTPKISTQEPTITQHIKKIQKTTFFTPKNTQKNRLQQPTNPVRYSLQTNNTKKIQKCCKTTQFCIFFIRRKTHAITRQTQTNHRQILAPDIHFVRTTETTEDAERHFVIPFQNNNFSLTRNAFVVAQFIAPRTFGFIKVGCVKFFALIEKCILKGYTKNGILS